MKKSKEKLKQTIVDSVADEEVQIALLEDIEDSFVEQEVDNTALEELQAKYDDLKQRYKDRFLKGKEKETEETKETEEKEEKEELKEVEELEKEDIFKNLDDEEE